MAKGVPKGSVGCKDERLGWETFMMWAMTTWPIQGSA